MPSCTNGSGVAAPSVQAAGAAPAAGFDNTTPAARPAATCENASASHQVRPPSNDVCRYQVIELPAVPATVPCVAMLLGTTPAPGPPRSWNVGDTCAVTAVVMGVLSR